MTIGILFSLIVGAGLMTLLFCSRRSGYDEPARIIPSDRDENQGPKTQADDVASERQGTDCSLPQRCADVRRSN